MKRIYSAEELKSVIQNWKTQTDKKIAFVPTMGALHDGHLSLMRQARQAGDFAIASVFVNPTQFAPHEDLKTYPRQEEKDCAMLQSVGMDVVYLPRVADIYPEGTGSDIKAGEPALGLESDFRPHFFDGVVNVVHRLFMQVRPDIAIFGEKDFQQLQVIKDMVARLAMPIEIIGAPIVRDAYGLALSSRNAYLSPAELDVARQLNRILFEAAKTGDTEKSAAGILAAGFDRVDYVGLRWGRVLAAAWIGKTRLIDNVPAAGTSGV